MGLISYIGLRVYDPNIAIMTSGWCLQLRGLGFKKQEGRDSAQCHAPSSATNARVLSRIEVRTPMTLDFNRTRDTVAYTDRNSSTHVSMLVVVPVLRPAATVAAAVAAIL